MNTRTVKPCGILYTQGREYFLLNPTPIARDSFQGDNLYRWVVVPRKVVAETEDDVEIYPIARHIVSNAFVVEYAPIPNILILVADIDDVASTEWLPEREDDNVDITYLEEVDTNEPLPCPFCGCPADNSDRDYVLCGNPDCYAFGPSNPKDNAGFDKIKAWNTRVDLRKDLLGG